MHRPFGEQGQDGRTNITRATTPAGATPAVADTARAETKIRAWPQTPTAAGPELKTGLGLSSAGIAFATALVGRSWTVTRMLLRPGSLLGAGAVLVRRSWTVTRMLLRTRSLLPGRFLPGSLVWPGVVLVERSWTAFGAGRKPGAGTFTRAENRFLVITGSEFRLLVVVGPLVVRLVARFPPDRKVILVDVEGFTQLPALFRESLVGCRPLFDNCF
jgi:hypothetical protein